MKCVFFCPFYVRGDRASGANGFTPDNWAETGWGFPDSRVRIVCLEVIVYACVCSFSWMALIIRASYKAILSPMNPNHTSVCVCVCGLAGTLCLEQPELECELLALSLPNTPNKHCRVRPVRVDRAHSRQWRLTSAVSPFPPTPLRASRVHVERHETPLNTNIYARDLGRLYDEGGQWSGKMFSQNTIVLPAAMRRRIFNEIVGASVKVHIWNKWKFIVHVRKWWEWTKHQEKDI